MVTLDVVEAVGAVCSGHRHHFGEVGKVHPVLSIFAPGDDGQEVEAPHDLLWNERSPDLAGGTGGLGGAIQEDDQLEILLVKCVHRHFKEGAALVYDVVECQRTNKEEVVLASVHHEVYVDLVHDHCLPVSCVSGPEELTVDLAPYHQGLAQIGHSDGQAKGAIFGTYDCHVTERDGLCPLFRQRDFGQDNSAHEAVDYGSNEGLDNKESHSSRTDWGQSSTAVPYGRLSLEGVKESCGKSEHIVDARNVILVLLLPRQVAVATCNPVPEQAEDKPAEGEGSDEEEEDEAPANLYKGGPEVGQKGKVVAVLDVSIFNVAAAVLGYQPGPAASTLRHIVSESFAQKSKHFLR